MCYVACISHLASGLQSKVRYLNMNMSFLSDSSETKLSESELKYFQSTVLCVLRVVSVDISFFLKEIQEEHLK